MKLNSIFLFLALLSFSINASTKNEINHLLNYVASTDCEYERNGTKHSGTEAVQHIQQKYKYYSDKVRSAEDFIKYAATKSKMSGKYYQIHCTNKPTIKSEKWLLAELKKYREGKTQ